MNLKCPLINIIYLHAAFFFLQERFLFVKETGTHGGKQRKKEHTSKYL